MVSIIIINYNTCQLTLNCISSIYRYVSGKFEIIVVGNASSEPCIQRIEREFPDVRLIANASNVGFAKGNNLGVSAAFGDHVLLLNSDTILSSDVITVLAGYLDRDPAVAAATCRLEYPDGRVQHNCQRFPAAKYLLFEFLRLQKIFPKDVGGRFLLGSFFDYRAVVYPDWIWGTCMMIRRKAIEELPARKLAEDFFMYGEDMQWCLDFRKIGYKVVFVPEAKVVHLMGMSGAKKNELMKKNEKLILRKYYTGIHRLSIKFLSKCLQWSQR